MSENNKNSSRWWEFNLVRYFLGTLVGSFIVYLVFNHFVDLFDKADGKYCETFGYLYEIQSFHIKYKIWIFLVFGFVFCYISSAPILVLHATRLRNNNQSFNYFVKYIILFTIFFAVFVFIVWCVNKFEKQSEWLIILVIILFSFFQIFQLLRTKKNDTIELYKKLTENREMMTTINMKSKATEPNGRKTYIESYKHLREHGNAFFIVILEIILGLLLYQIKTPEMMIACILIWILPGSLIWFFGNYLESDLYK
jgi:hypothetical protein